MHIAHLLKTRNGQRNNIQLKFIDLDGPAQGRALNLLVLLMAFEHRATLLELLRLLNKISQFQASNKMSEHNVAMIMAPTLFPPR